MKNKPIGIFDSGVGGLSVLRTIKKLLPNEKFIYYADFQNAPYGLKSKQEIIKNALGCMEYLMECDIKACVVACNTATSAAVDELRNKYNIPVLGIEPAIKPASIKIASGKTLVLATPATLKLMKFQKLYESLGNKDVVPVECPGLSELIESAKPKSNEIGNYLNDIFREHKNEDIAAVVIGCTHFSFIEEDIKKTLANIDVFDGRYGTARYLKKVLEEKDLLSDSETKVELISNSEHIKYQKLLIEFMQLPLFSRE